MFSASITIAIPAYNEEKTIVGVVKKTLADLEMYFNDYEVVVVDDGSTDGTGAVLDVMQKKFRKLRVIHQPNGGYSAAMLMGIKAARMEFIAYVPGDGQFLVPDMLKAFEVMAQADLVLGYRDRRADYSAYRLLLSYGYLTLLWLLFGVKYKDVGWVNIWKADQVKKLPLKPSRGIFLLTEILVRLKQQGKTIIEVPSKYHSRKAGTAKNAKISVAIDTFKKALELWWQLR